MPGSWLYRADKDYLEHNVQDKRGIYYRRQKWRKEEAAESPMLWFSRPGDQ